MSFSCGHAGAEVADDGVEQVVLGAHDEAGERVGLELAQRLIALLAPGGVALALGGAARIGTTTRPASGS
jgi:hypothetical protein